MSDNIPENSTATSEIGRLIEAVRSGGDADAYAGKRHATRFAEGIVLELTTDPARPDRTQTVYMHNMSEGGFAFWSRHRIEMRTSIHVRELAEQPGARPWLPAQVTHCTVGIRGFLIGARFDDPPRAA